MIKIAYVVDALVSDKAGTEKQLIHVLRHLDRKKFQPFVICLRQTEWTKTHSLPCPVFFLGYRGFLKTDFPLALRKFSQLLKQHRFDIVQTFFEESLFICYLGTLLQKKPVLLASRRDIGLAQGELWYHKLYRFLWPLVYKRYDGVLVNGKSIKEHIRQTAKIPDSKIQVIPNALVAASQESEGQTPRLFQEVSASLWIGMTANLTPVKRGDLFLKSLALLIKDHGLSHVHAVVLGDGPEKDRLIRLAESLGISQQVHFAGSVDNVKAYLRHLDIGVLCSDQEGFSNAILEYLEAGLPVVATAVGGNQELVDSSHGVCVPPSDPQALAQALAALAKNPNMRQQMGEKSRQKAQNYSLENTVAMLEKYYEQVVRQN